MRAAFAAVASFAVIGTWGAQSARAARPGARSSFLRSYARESGARSRRGVFSRREGANGVELLRVCAKSEIRFQNFQTVRKLCFDILFGHCSRNHNVFAGFP